MSPPAGPPSSPPSSARPSKAGLISVPAPSKRSTSVYKGQDSLTARSWRSRRSASTAWSPRACGSWRTRSSSCAASTTPMSLSSTSWSPLACPAASTSSSTTCSTAASHAFNFTLPQGSSTATTEECYIAASRGQIDKYAFGEITGC